MRGTLARPYFQQLIRAALFGALSIVIGGGGVGAFAEPVEPPLPSGDQVSAPALTSQQSSLFALPTTRDHVGRVVIAATVNGKGPFRFIVDTGATNSTITPALARALGLTPTEDVAFVVNGITGTARVSAVTLDRLRTGDLTVERLRVPIVGAEVMAGADGILGAAGLTEKSLSVDFQRNRVAISGGVESGFRSYAFRIHATRLTHGLMSLPLRVGRVDTIAVIDTGAERTLGNFALRDALNSRRRPGTPALVTSVFGATAQVEPGEILRAPTISIDRFRIEDVAVVYGDFHIFKVWDMQDKPAIIIGMDVLGTVGSFAIDFRNQDVYLTSSTALSPTFKPRSSLGNSTQVH